MESLTPIPEKCYSKMAYGLFGGGMCNDCQKLCNPDSPVNKKVLKVRSNKPSWLEEAYQRFVFFAISV
jgi:hypothetical protein